MNNAIDIAVHIQTLHGWHIINIDEHQVRVHPRYKFNLRTPNDNDIALITLNQALNFNGTFGPAATVGKDYKYNTVEDVLVYGVVPSYGELLPNWLPETTYVLNSFHAKTSGHFAAVMPFVFIPAPKYGYGPYFTFHYYGGAVYSKAKKVIGFATGVPIDYHATHFVPIAPYKDFLQKKSES